MWQWALDTVILRGCHCFLVKSTCNWAFYNPSNHLGKKYDMQCPLHVITALLLPGFYNMSYHVPLRATSLDTGNAIARDNTMLTGQAESWLASTQDGKNACNLWESLASIRTVIGQREPLWEICGANVFPDNPILWASGSGVVTMAEKHNKHMCVPQEGGTKGWECFLRVGVHELRGSES